VSTEVLERIATSPNEVETAPSVQVASIWVEVTRDDIHEGIMGNGTACPIALALYRTTGKAWMVSGLQALDRKTGTIYTLPLEAQLFVREFDAPLRRLSLLAWSPGVRPFRFQLDAETIKERERFLQCSPS
jgi:hypothetical protein